MTRKRLPLIFAGVLLAFALYAYGVPARPPGFYTDESSIAYNAHTISQTGRDEYGETLPLFFRAFGEYKNPTYVYLLAALFRLTGPSIFTARLLSASLGCVAALLLGLLAARTARSTRTGVAVTASALLTPWLYESSRLVFEVAAYPLALALFLLALRRASERARWTWTDIAALASTLALLTYTYSIGRLLAPLLAAGLFIFAARGRLRFVLLTLTAYALTLVPALVFHLHHPGALTARFQLLTYATPRSSTVDVIAGFLHQYFINLSPWRMLLTGELNIRDHVPDVGALLAPTLALAVAGLILILRSRRGDAWWRFCIYALLASVVPASLTRDEFPQLRLIAVPVFLHLLTAPAWSWLLTNDEATATNNEATTDEATTNEATTTGEVKRARTSATNAALKRASSKRSTLRRACLLLLLIATLAQGFYFQWLFQRGGPERGYVFESHYAGKVLAAATRLNLRPIYLKDAPGHAGYIQAYWHGLLRGFDATQFRRLPADARAPAGAVVISTEDVCSDCRVITKRINYLVYATEPTGVRATAAPLAEGSFRARINASKLPGALKAGRKLNVRVEITNLSDERWPAVGQPDGSFRVVLGWRWLKTDGTDAHVEGETRLPFDLDAGEFCAVETEIIAPGAPGDYTLELDMLQAGVARFGEKGSKPLRSAVRVEE